ncbi:MAG: hypothetical protein WCD53_12285 [Microcoleus sp.]
MNCSDIPKNYDRHFRTRQRNSAIANHNLRSTVTVAQLLIIPLCDR